MRTILTDLAKSFPCIGLVFRDFVYDYTDDMYKMMRDTKRQLEERIGPAVPVCIASGRSPEEKIKFDYINLH